LGGKLSVRLYLALRLVSNVVKVKVKVKVHQHSCVRLLASGSFEHSVSLLCVEEMSKMGKTEPLVCAVIAPSSINVQGSRNICLQSVCGVL
jgi:hypothetical protein